MRRYLVVPVYLVLVFGLAVAGAQPPPQHAPNAVSLNDLIQQRRLADVYKQRSQEVDAGALSTIPAPLPRMDPNAPTAEVAPDAQAIENASRAQLPRLLDGLDDSVKWLIIGGVLVVVWQIIKALGRGAKAVSKVVVTAAVDAAPAARQTAGRVSSTALSGAKSFFAETKKCPNCAELIKKEAKVCRFCQCSVS